MVVRALPVHRLGGLELHTRDLAVALAERGHEVHLVTSAKPRPGTACSDAPSLPDNITVNYLPIGTPGDYSALYFAGIGAYARQICRRIGGADILHTQEFAGLFMKHPSPEIAASWVTTVHGTMLSETALDHRYLRKMPWSKIFGAINRNKSRLALIPQFRKSLKKTDRIVTDSEFTQLALLRMNKNLQSKISVVPLGLDARRYNVPSDGLPPCVPLPAGLAPAPLTVAMLGRMQDLKGIPDALAAARILKKADIRVNFKIAGGGEGYEDAKDFVAKHQLHDSVELLGHLAPNEVSNFLSNADLMLFPDRTQPAFGLVAAEAMLHGLPVIGTKCGAIPEIVEDGENGWLVNAWAPQEIADLLARLSMTEARTEILSMAQGAHRHVRRLMASDMAAAMESVYEQSLPTSFL